MKKIKISTIQQKLALSSAIVIFMMALLIELCVYTVVSTMQLNDAIQLNNQLTQTMGQSFDTSVEAFKQQINFVTMNQELQQALKTGRQPGEDAYQYTTKVRSIVVNQILTTDQIEGIYLYGKDQQLITHWQKKYRPQDPYVLYPQMNPEEFDPSGKIQLSFKDGRLRYQRAIRDTQTLECIGYATFLYDMDSLERNLDTITSNANRFAAVLDAQGQIVVHNYEDDQILAYIMEKMDLSASVEDLQMKLPYMGDSVVCSYDSFVPGWKIICVTEKAQLQRSSAMVQLIVVAIGLICAGIGVFVQTMNARRIVYPLSLMGKSIQSIQQGNYKNRVNVKTGDEIELLADAMNQMQDEIDALVNKNLKSEIAHKDMQLLSLQAQINPHFLYNTLECINSLAQLDRKEDVRRVTVAFSNIMKSLAGGPKFVTVESELDYVQDFLTIYKILLGKRLEYGIELDPTCKEIRIPRMLIQPLVENAVLHGVKPRPEGGHVDISVCRSIDSVLISVSDDGIGMSPGQKAAIETYGRTGQYEGDAHIGLGIRNVLDRVRLVYAETWSLEVQSSPEWGTTITIILPQ